MRDTKAPLPLVFAIAVTRGLAGVGLGLLLSERIGRRNRREIGGVLLGIGVLSTIPLAIGLFKKSRRDMPTVANVPQSGVDPTEGLRAD